MFVLLCCSEQTNTQGLANDYQEADEGTLAETDCKSRQSDYITEDMHKVCCPDVQTPFRNVEDALERLLPYHVRPCAACYRKSAHAASCSLAALSPLVEMSICVIQGFRCSASDAPRLCKPQLQ